MEDATDVFEDVFVSNSQPHAVSAAISPDRATKSFFSPLRTQSSRYEQAERQTLPMNINMPLGSVATINSVKSQDDEDSSITMDVTRAVGRIDDDNDDQEEQTMEITQAFSLIQRNNNYDDSVAAADETIGMDVTRAIGSIQNGPSYDDDDDDDDNVTMDVTRAVGTIQTEVQDDDTDLAMDVTRAIGMIQPGSHNNDYHEDDNITMDVTKAIGTIQTGFTDDDDTGVTMDVTRAMGTIEFGLQDENDNNDDTGVSMDFTTAVGFINSSLNPEEKSGKNEQQMEIANNFDPFGNVDSKLTSVDGSSPGKVKQQIIKTAPTVPATLPSDGNLPETPTKPSAVTSIRNMIQSESRIRHKASPRSSDVLKKRRRSLLEGGAIVPEFEGTKISIGTPEGHKLKNDIQTTLMSVNSNSLQKKIQSLTPRKMARTLIKPRNSTSKSATAVAAAAVAESLRVEEQAALAKVYSPLKPVQSHQSPTKLAAHKNVRLLADIPVMLPLAGPTILTESKVPLASQGLIENKNLEDNDNYEPISLNEFLRMASVQFLEGLNTKRRNTTFIQAADVISEPTFADTVQSKLLHCPMLELFEFSCRELRKNIEEGDELFSRLEAETTEENPLLFKQYLSSSIDQQAAFCAQFKTIKNFARLKSKGVWYEWRSKLLDGVMSGLSKNLTSLQADLQSLTRFEQDLAPSLQDISSRHAELKSNLEALRQRRSEVNDCNKEELAAVRERVRLFEQETADKEAVKSGLLQEQSLTERSIQNSTLSIESTKNDITNAERLIEENKSVDSSEILVNKEILQTLQTLTGWKIEKIKNNFLNLSLSDQLMAEICLEPVSIANVLLKNSNSSTVDTFFVECAKEAASGQANICNAISEISRIWHAHDEFEREASRLSSHYITTTEVDNQCLVTKVEVFWSHKRTKVIAKSRLAMADVVAGRNNAATVKSSQWSKVDAILFVLFF
ncbi:Spc7 kinetochore protein-domain-containing protein [Lipomyces japonicus]|uniref:Spc7 kinetochore protein-domain-containing protein n=1 Tax=Lipomyces japonicus TaxID=56871 RepID=UPI0034CDA693